MVQRPTSHDVMSEKAVTALFKNVFIAIQTCADASRFKYPEL
jgi:hypothetical protein